jgi:hypothetical protein
MLDGMLDDILGDSPKRGEIRPDSPAVRPGESLDIPELSPNSPNSPGLEIWGEDRHHCRECLSLNRNGYCIKQRFKPVDEIPRRCEDFHGMPPVIDRNTTPKPTSEAEHNAHGRFFKFLATWLDGKQCYLCQMPRQTVDEMLAQFPDAATIQPIENEDYTDDE